METGWSAGEAFGERLAARGWRVATAESCTGGWVAKLLTDVAGSSRWFERGWVTYSNAAKQAELGVPSALLDSCGAVSREVVLAMAEGALARAGADFAVAVSGIAGPTGATPGKPVGTVWLAWAWRGEGRLETEAARHWLPGDREAVRRQTALLALEGLVSRVPPPPL